MSYNKNKNNYINYIKIKITIYKKITIFPHIDIGHQSKRFKVFIFYRRKEIGMKIEKKKMSAKTIS